MEDSYTVHRRRKAAARKREKTPEPPKRLQDDVTGTDEEDDARARMEQMVQETEKLEELEETERRRLELAKTSENIEKVVSSPEKAQRILKRAMSPEVRRTDEEIHERETKTVVEVSKREMNEKTDKTETRNAETKKISGIVSVTPEIIDETKDFGRETTRKSRKSEADDETGVSRGIVSRRRRDVEKDVGMENEEKSVRNVKKTMSPDIERHDKNRPVTEANRPRELYEDTRDLTGARKTSSRAVDEAEQAVTLDENRYEAVARENDAGHTTRSVSGKNETQASLKLNRNDDEKEKEEKEEATRRSRTQEISDKSSRSNDENVRVRKREILSPSKTRSSESRVTTSKRSSKDRNIERTGYTTDSSDNEEITKRVLRRKKSPEGAKLRSTSVKKIASRSRPTTDTDGDIEEQEQRKIIERKSTNRRKPSSESDEDLSFKNRTASPTRQEKQDAAPRVPSRQSERTRSGEKRSTSRARYSSSEVNEEDSRIMRKSGTFPVETTQHDGSSSIARSMPEIKKQIIPLSDDSLIEDFEKAQRDYMRKERGILDHDPMDDYVNPRMEAALRQRKFSVIQTELEAREVTVQVEKPEKKSWFAWLPFVGKRAKKEKLEDEKTAKENVEDGKPLRKNEKSDEKLEIKKETLNAEKKISFYEFFRTLADFMSEFKAFIEQNPRETRVIRIMRNRCIVELLLAIIYCGLGAFVFRFTEGAFETFYKCGVKRVKRDFLDSLWNFSHNMREEDWKSMARRKLMEFEEQLHTAHEAGVHSYSGQKSWSFLNAVVYCLTVITTIGYGHISPSTTTGRAITIIYAIFGIPMFLIILADFGKLFTRGIKFLWAFVRRVYYTGSCRRVRRTVPVQEVMKGVQLVYDLATFRRPSQMNPEEIEEMQKQQNQTQTVLNLDGNAPPQSAQPDTPGTPALSTFAIDDEFNLPISVAIVILLAYIFVGATVYNFWEQWGFFESFYFVFISMSTIGFGDYVPKHPIYMMLSIVYLVFGLALTSMCINVVQVMLSDSFKQASQKIGATIGFEVAEDDGSVQPAVPAPVELADVHTTIKESESEEQVAPKAKQEDMEL